MTYLKIYEEKRMKFRFAILATLLTFSLASFATPNDKASEAKVAEKVQAVDKIAAIVNDDVITQSDLKQQVDTMKQQMAATGQPMPPDSALYKQLLQHMVDVKLQLQLAKDADISVNDAQIKAAVKTIADQNHMSVADLMQALKSQGMTYDQYKDQVREQLIITELQRRMVSSNIDITEEDVTNFLKTHKNTGHENEQFRVQDLLIALPEEPSSEEVTKARTKAQSLVEKLKAGGDFSQTAMSESNGDLALQGGDLGWRKLEELPDVFAKQIATMQVNDITTPIRTGNGYHILKLAGKRGNTVKKHYITETHVRHILLRQDALMTDKELQQKLLKIRREIERGKNFGAMAKEYSQDPGSSAKGGDLGWMRPEKLVPEFTHVMNKLSIKEVSKPVKTAYGWHIIQVLERRKIDDTNTVARNKARNILFQQKFNVALQRWLQTLRTQGYVKVVAND